MTGRLSPTASREHIMPAGRWHGRAPLVLMINDQEWSTRSLETILGPNGYAILRAYTGRLGLERARKAQPDMILLDESLPDMSGLELCLALRDDPSTRPGTPLIMTTSGRPTRQQRLAALRAGAWDFMGHPLDAEELILRLDTYVGSKLAADRAWEEGLLDRLTGLYNLQGLARRARELGSQATRRHDPLACVVFRIELPEEALDDDGTLEESAARLAGLLRDSGRASDAVGRVGNFEFAVYAPGTNSDGAARLAERIGDALSEKDVLQNGSSLRVGYHGVEDFEAAHVEPLDLMIHATDALRKGRRESGPTEWLHQFQSNAVRS